MGFGWLSAAEVIGLIVLLLALCVIGFAVRGRWLARNGGTFECSMRRLHHDLDHNIDHKIPNPSEPTTTPSTNWVLGVARYSGDYLEWFRFFSLAWWPKHSFPRSEVSVLGHRAPTETEAVALYADQEVVTVCTGSGATSEHRDLAMTADSFTGMLSWLESAPPGIGY